MTLSWEYDCVKSKWCETQGAAYQPLTAFSFLSLSIRSALLKNRLAFGLLGFFPSPLLRLPDGPLGIPCSARVLFQLEVSFPSGGSRGCRYGPVCRLTFSPRSLSSLALG